MVVGRGRRVATFQDCIFIEIDVNSLREGGRRAMVRREGEKEKDREAGREEREE